MNREIVERIVGDVFDALEEHRIISQWEMVGSYRRGKEILDEADVIAISKVDSATFDDALRTLGITKFEANGDKIKRFTFQRLKFDVLLVERKYWGAAKLYRTGNAQLNIVMRIIAKRKGLKLNEYGLWKDDIQLANSETAIFRELGYKFVPPKFRNPKDVKRYKIRG